MSSENQPRHRAWSRLPADGAWREVLLERDAGSRVAAAVMTAFPGAVVRAVMTDVIGQHEARIQTARGQRLSVRLDGTYSVTGCQTEERGQRSIPVSTAA